ncbi:hypothetical protein O6H91_18G042100 [Diphasiastrum complanatum]|uniref:Uncharacterized protein n=1 Tax=Diphasiastrum complanatum TaxID=34168 RepID=A0ACC2B0B9_DIPCM|nr:hypothetical protein O6H91_18G042100 [Diphasiastrum complanatum]
MAVTRVCPLSIFPASLSLPVKISYSKAALHSTAKRSTLQSFQFTLQAPLAFGAAAVVGWSIFHADAMLAQPASRAETLFEQTCAGCHSGGGNVLQPGATLALKDLERNGLDTVDDIYNITYYGKGRMPGYGETCTPRGQCTFGPRISEEDIRALAKFVKLQANQGWLSSK